MAEKEEEEEEGPVSVWDQTNTSSTFSTRHAIMSDSKNQIRNQLENHQRTRGFPNPTLNDIDFEKEDSRWH